MGYFANGIEGESYKSCYCYNCKNWTKRDGQDVEGCPIWDLHLEYNYELCNDPDSFLCFYRRNWRENMSDKEMLLYAQAYRALTKATAEISNDIEDQKRFEIIDWLVKQAEQTEKYREVLEFYASGNHYLVYYDKIILLDDGEKARQALEGE